MHPDRKIGFALGILLIGIVAALFFRNEELLDSGRPSVTDRDDLRQTLTDRGAPVYNDEDRSLEERDTPWTLHEFFNELKEKNASAPRPVSHPPQAGNNSSEDASVRPDSPGWPAVDNVIGQSDPEEAPTIAENTTEASPFDLSPASSKSAGDDNEASSETETQMTEYQVQYGDTLSEIAEEFLGTQTRYRELYEMNRDRMKSPDHLRVGMQLRVPRRIH